MAEQLGLGDAGAAQFGSCGSCKRQVRWATTNTGKPMPLEPHPRDDGNVALVDVGGQCLAIVLSDANPNAPRGRPVLSIARRQVTLYLAHFAVCPNAPQHRKRRAASSV